MRFNPLVLFPFFLTLLFFCSNAFAANRVVVLRNTAPRLAEELVRELEASGFEAEIIDDTPDDALEEIAGRNNASAAIRLNLKGKRVEVWVADRITGKIVARTVELNPGGEPENSIVVLAAVELLRASLMEIYSPQKPEEGDVPIAEETRSFARPVPVKPADNKISAGFFSLGFGGGFIGKADGIGAHGAATFTLQLAGRFQFGFLGHFTFFPHSVSAEEGATYLYPILAGLHTIVLMRSPSKRFRPFAGLGMGTLIFLSRGKAAEGIVLENSVLRERRQTAIVPVPFAKCGLLLRLNRHLLLRIDITLGVPTALTRIEIADNAVARIGRPVILSSLMLDIAIW
jgi:hypothetical protein